MNSARRQGKEDQNSRDSSQRTYTPEERTPYIVAPGVSKATDIRNRPDVKDFGFGLAAK